MRQFKLRLNLNQCTIRVRSGKLLGVIVSERGIEVDPANKKKQKQKKQKKMQEMPEPKTKTKKRANGQVDIAKGH